MDWAGRYYNVAAAQYRPAGRYRLYNAAELESRPLTAAADSGTIR